MTQIILVRHGDSRWTEEAKYHKVRLFGGRMNDCPLSTAGKQQAHQLPSALVRAGIKPDAVYSSIAKRAMDTAAPSAKVFGLRINKVVELQELTWGDWEEGPRSIQDEEPFKTQRQKLGFDFRPGTFKKGESPNDVRTSRLDALWKINNQGHACVLVFTHRNVIMNVVRDAMGWKTPEEQGNAVVDVCSLTTIEFQSRGKLTVLGFSETLA